MIQQHYSITINAPAAKVWECMLSKEGYKQWTKPFNPAGSWYEGERIKGTKMLFLGPDPSDIDRIGGMVSEIADIRPNEFVSIEHKGEVSDGVEDTTSERVQMRNGAHENYTLKEENGVTTVDVDLDVTEEFAEYMNDTRPKALVKLKEICEVE